MNILLCYILDGDAFFSKVSGEVAQSFGVDVESSRCQIPDLASEDKRIDVCLPVRTHLEVVDEFVKSLEMIFHDFS